MKSLCSSAPFAKTESGMRTLGRPDDERETGAKRFRVLFSKALILSTREVVAAGTVGEWLSGMVTKEGMGRRGSDVGFPEEEGISGWG